MQSKWVVGHFNGEENEALELLELNISSETLNGDCLSLRDMLYFSHNRLHSIVFSYVAWMEQFSRLQELLNKGHDLYVIYWRFFKKN